MQQFCRSVRFKAVMTKLDIKIMRTLQAVFLLFMLLLMFSCQQDELPVPQEADLWGSWRLQTQDIQDENREAVENSFPASALMSIDENGSFYRNYVSGSWNLNGRLATFVPSNSAMEVTSYRILEMTESSLKWEARLTEKELLFNIPGIDRDQTLIVTEVFMKE